MYTLFISTYDKIITIALLKDGEVLEVSKKESSRNHSVYTVNMIDKILKNNSIDTHYLNEIIVVNGPGSFTGVRIGVTIAKTLAYTLNIPIKTITSLEAISLGVDNDLDKKIVTIKDLKGAFVGYFDKNNEIITNYMYMNKDSYNDFIKDKEKYIVESDAMNISKIYNYMKSKESVNPHLVNPIYIKGIDALNGK